MVFVKSKEVLASVRCFWKDTVSALCFIIFLSVSLFIHFKILQFYKSYSVTAKLHRKNIL